MKSSYHFPPKVIMPWSKLLKPWNLLLLFTRRTGSFSFCSQIKFHPVVLFALDIIGLKYQSDIVTSDTINEFSYFHYSLLFHRVFFYPLLISFLSQSYFELASLVHCIISQ